MASENIGAIEFEFTAKNIKHLKQTDSEIVHVRGLPWFIRLQKVIQGKQMPSLGVHLLCNHKEKDQKWAVIARATVKLLSSKVNRTAHKIFLERCNFNPKKLMIEKDLFISYSQLLNPKNGFVYNDTCSFKVKIEADCLQRASLKMESIQKFYGINGKFRFEISKDDRMFGACSSEFMLARIPWQILVVKRGDKSQIDDGSTPITTKFVQIQLYNNGFTDEEKDWSCRATLKCRLISCHPKIRARQSIIENVKFDQTAANASLRLIAWNELEDPSNKFIENGSCSIEWELIIDDIQGFTEETFTDAVKPSERGAVEMECPICFENMINRTVYSTLCGHVFHRVCLWNSVKRKKECPQCRKEYKGGVKIHLPELH